MSEAYDRVLDALRDHGSTVVVRGSRAIAQCPAHPDRKPSLSISDRDGRVLLHCHAGCETSAILDMLDLTFDALFDGEGDDGYRPYTYREKVVCRPARAMANWRTLFDEEPPS